MRCVVDASVAVAWLLPAHRSEAVQRFWADAITNDWEMIVPAQFYAESASAVRLRVARRQIDVSEGDAIFDDLIALPVVERAPRGLLQRAWALAKRYSHGRIYDAQYLALAEMERCELWTLDRRLVRSVQPHLQWVHAVDEEYA